MRTLLFGSLLFAAAAVAQQPSADQAFYKQAAEAGMAEVEAGTLAQSKATMPEVQEFGAMMVKEHTAANEKLMAIAKGKNVMLPTALNAEHQSMKKKLEAMSGADFDKAYINGQVTDHTKVAALLQTEISSGKDADAKAWATETLPAVKTHLAMAKKLAGGGMGAKGGMDKMDHPKQ